MSSGIHNLDPDDLDNYRCDPDEVQRFERDAIRRETDKVCAQCKHFYVPIDDANQQEHYRRLIKANDNDNSIDERSREEIRLCYEFHWCNAASPACDNDFEQMTDIEYGESLTKQGVDGLLDDDFEQMLDEDKPEIKWVPETEGINRPTSVHKPMPQKEIQYVYIGLLQENPDAVQGTLEEVPTEIDGVATNYRRVEMGPLDWDLLFMNNSDVNVDINYALRNLNTATNAVDIDFPVAQTDWCGLTHFGLYNSPVGGTLICISEFIVCMDILAGNCAAITEGIAEIPLEYLTDEQQQ